MHEAGPNDLEKVSAAQNQNWSVCGRPSKIDDVSLHNMQSEANPVCAGQMRLVCCEKANVCCC